MSRHTVPIHPCGVATRWAGCAAIQRRTGDAWCWQRLAIMGPRGAMLAASCVQGLPHSDLPSRLLRFCESGSVGLLARLAFLAAAGIRNGKTKSEPSRTAGLHL